jgi:hypothetical protein
VDKLESSGGEFWLALAKNPDNPLAVVGHLQSHIFGIPLVYQARSRKFALELGGFVLQQVVVTGTTAHNFARTSEAEPLSSGATGLELRHDFLATAQSIILSCRATFRQHLPSSLKNSYYFLSVSFEEQVRQPYV